MSELKVEIAKVYTYRSARIQNGVVLPREVFDFVYDELSQRDKDNHIVVECTIRGHNTERLGILFSDTICIVGTSRNIKIESW